jgi:hypothetical protein
MLRHEGTCVGDGGSVLHGTRHAVLDVRCRSATVRDPLAAVVYASTMAALAASGSAGASPDGGGQLAAAHQGLVLLPARLEHWPDEPKIVERVGLRSCRRRAAAIDLILGRSNLGVYRW